MKIHVAREDLLMALQRVQGVVEKRNTMPILANILLEAKPHQIFQKNSLNQEVLLKPIRPFLAQLI